MATNIKFTTNAKSVIKQLKSLGNATTSTNGKFKQSQTQIKKVNNKLGNMSKDANRASNGFKKLGGSMSVFKKLLGTAVIYKFGQAMAKATQSTIDMIETVNLFSVSLGDMAVETNKTVTAMAEFYGLDTTNLQNTVGTYALLARSMGMTSAQASILATNTAQLAIDLASLTNVPVEQVMQDLRSGLVGQSETVYKYGIDVTEAGLKTEAMAENITKSVRNMSQGEKMGLRYNAMIRTTGIAQGDFARTLEQPANQLKILSERFTTLSRAVGSLFVPTLEVVLPYLNATVKYLTKLINLLAIAVGYEAPEVTNMNTNSISDIGDDAEASEDAINSLTKSLLGFDETNQLTSASSTSTSSNSILESMSLSEYDGFMDIVSEKTAKITAQVETMFSKLGEFFQPIASGVSDLWDAMKPYNEQFGKGLLDFLEGFGSVPLDILDKLFGEDGIISKITDLLNSNSPYESLGVAGMPSDIYSNLQGDAPLKSSDNIKELGENFGKLATALLLFKVGGTVAKALSSLITSLTSLSTFGIITVGIGLIWLGFNVGKELNKVLDDDMDDIVNNYSFGDATKLAISENQDIVRDATFNMLKDLWASSPQMLIQGWIQEAFKSIGEAIKSEFVAGGLIYDAFEFDFIKNQFENKLDDWDLFKDWWEDKVRPMFAERKWSELATTALSAFKRGILLSLNEIINTWNDKVKGTKLDALQIEPFEIEFKVNTTYSSSGKVPYANTSSSSSSSVSQSQIEAIKEEISNSVLQASLGSITPILEDTEELVKKIAYVGSKAGMPSNIPHMARGGILNNETSIVAGESGREAIVPLENNTEWMTKLKNELSSNSASENNESTLILEINGKKWAQATIKDFEKESRRQGGLKVKLA